MNSKGKTKKTTRTFSNKTIETTIHLHKRLHGIQFKKRAPRAIKEIKKLAYSLMRTEDVRIDSNLNKHIWHKGIRNVPGRIRLSIECKRSEDEETQDTFYTLVSHIPVDNFHHLSTKKKEE